MIQKFLFTAMLAVGSYCCIAQNIPSGVELPSAPSLPTVALPVDFTPPTTGLNFTRSFVPFVPVINSGSPMFSLVPDMTITPNYLCAAVTSYQDGWGDNLQSVTRSLPGQADIVAVADHRQSLVTTQFLPYPAPFGAHFQTSPFSDQRAYFSTSHPEEADMTYSQTMLSSSGGIPTTKSYLPGSSFVGSGNGTTITTTINNGSEGIIKYRVTYPYGGRINDGNYNPGELIIKTTVTPHGGNVKEFFDKDNKEVCKIVNAEVGGVLVPNTTYYIYNNLNQLVFTVTPMGSQILATTPTADITELQHANRYNAYGSIVAKTIPGHNGIDYTIYDRNNRPVLFQTPLLKSLGQYKFNLYDSRDRVVLSGILNSSDLPDTWQSNLYADPGTLTLTYGTLLYYFLMGVPDAYPVTIPGCEIDIVNFYDQYTIPRTFSTAYAAYYQSMTWAVAPVPYKLVAGLTTASLSRVKDGGLGVSSDKWVCSVPFYDQHGRVIQVQSINAEHAQSYADCLLGAPSAAWDVLTSQYAFSGQKLRNILFYNGLPGSDKLTTTIVNTFDLDMMHGGRVKSEYQTIDGGAAVMIAQYTYNELGQVIKKSLGDVEVQQYDYNIRGQLTGINKNYALNPCSVAQSTFGAILSYDYGFSIPRYDGSISGFRWRGASHSSPLRAYGYEYDHAGRLVKAEFRQFCNPALNDIDCSYSGPASWNKGRSDFTVSNLKYDLNGNILSMNQRGTTALGPVDMDQLTYGYKYGSNTLLNVTDVVSIDYHLGDFKDVIPACSTGGIFSLDGPPDDGGGTGTTTPLPPAACNDYTYDDDGNLTADSNKHISRIIYNENDQPLSVTYDNGSVITNVYTSTGALISKSIAAVDETPYSYHYSGPLVYKIVDGIPTGLLQYALHDEGRATFNAMTGLFTYDYFVKDHLGNIRTVVTGNVTNSAEGGGTTLTPAYLSYVATHEVAMGGFETAIFSNIENVRAERPASTDTSNTQAAKMNASDSTRRVGTAIMLKVMAGDQFSISAQSYWAGEVTPADTVSTSAMLHAIISTLSGAQGNTAVGENTGAQLVGSAFTPDNYAIYQHMLDSLTDAGTPKAYINYLLFDEHMNIIPGQCGAIQVSSTAGSWQLIGTGGPLTVVSSGYLAVYISDVTSGKDVYVDPLVIGLASGPLIQEQHYYPFGLAINEGEALGPIRNKFKYQGKELGDEIGLNLYDFTARQYDPQIGRFWGIDPANQYPSGYTGMGNDPANMIDPTGCQTVSSSGLGGSFNFAQPFSSNPDLHPITPQEIQASAEYQLTQADRLFYVNLNRLEFFSNQGIAVIGKEKKSELKLIKFMTFDEFNNAAKDGGRGVPDGTIWMDIDGKFLSYFKVDNSSTQADVMTSDGANKEGGGGEGHEWTYTANNLIGSFGVGWGAKENLMDFAAKAAPAIEELGYFKAVKIGSKGLLLGQVVVSATQLIKAYNRSDRNWSTNDGNKWGVAGKAALDITMGAIGTFGGPIGWGISGIYFLGDAAGLWGNWGEVPKN